MQFLDECRALVLKSKQDFEDTRAALLSSGWRFRGCDAQGRWRAELHKKGHGRTHSVVARTGADLVAQARAIHDGCTVRR